MKKYFLTGLVILLPATVTIAILIFVLNFLTKPFIGFMMKIISQTRIKDLSFYFFTSDQVIHYGSQIIIIIGLVLITLIIGYITQWFFIKSVINVSDSILKKIPIINKVYKTTQDIIKTIFVSDKKSFKQVVLVPFPDKTTYSIGLVSRESPEVCSEAKGAELITVLIPTTPNPTTGFLLMFKKEDLIYLDMKTEDAVKYIVSCGVIIPPVKETKASE